MVESSSSTAFTLQLNFLVKGAKLLLPEANCTFTYYWDAERREGKAQLLGINGSMLAISLNLENPVDTLLFLSDMQPTLYKIKGVDVVISKIYLKIHPENNTKEAAILFGYDGVTVQATANYAWPDL